MQIANQTSNGVASEVCTRRKSFFLPRHTNDGMPGLVNKTMADSVLNPSNGLLQSAFNSVNCEAFGEYHTFQITEGNSFVQSYFTLSKPVAFIWIIFAYSAIVVSSVWLHRNNTVDILNTPQNALQRIYLALSSDGSKFSIKASRNSTNGVANLDVALSAILFYPNN